MLRDAMKQELGKAPLFSGLTDGQLGWLADQARSSRLEAGEYVVRQGDVPGVFFVQLDGETEWTKGVDEGTGLGPDIVRRIVVGVHGGDVRVLSDPNGGDTCFQVRLPVNPPARPEEG